MSDRTVGPAPPLPARDAGDDRVDDAFAAVYTAERPAVVRLAFLLVRTGSVAEELAQEAFVRLFERQVEVANPAAFLRTVVVRLAIDWLRRHEMERERLTVVAAGHPGVGEPVLDGTWEALGRLRPERRAVLVLRFYEDMSHGDIARLLGCPTATIRSRTRRALSDLRELMDDEREETPDEH